jgi:hypothetical protein
MTPNPRSYPSTGEVARLLDRNQDRLEQLRREHPGWRIWNVPRVNGPTTWHAEPARYPLNAADPGELEEYLRTDERLHSGPGPEPAGGTASPRGG